MIEKAEIKGICASGCSLFSGLATAVGDGKHRVNSSQWTADRAAGLHFGVTQDVLKY